RGDYKSVKEHASKVCNVLSDEFKARVAADREKQAQEKAEAERLAQEKAQAQQSPIVEQPVYVGPLEVSAVPMPNHFSPDGDGNNDTITFNFSIKGGYTVKQWKFEIFEEAIVDPSSATTAQQKRLFAVRTGIGEPPSTFVWNGKSDKNELVESGVYYPFTFTVTDEKGNIAKAEGKIRADILIVKEGDTIELRIPSFIFRSDTADFLGLNKEIIQMNLDLLEQLAKLFNALPEYSIRIEGHANNVGKMLGYSAARIQTEESKEVLPLSLARAEKIKSLLIEKGVSASRITVAGLGSSKPIVSFTDLANRWKNRRVEFILKKQ
ncbi:MAG TPA: OmpA family protein, partial [Spirochaetales bacterium]|nr:OmpA family protein [Spirochaetales bacterium]